MEDLSNFSFDSMLSGMNEDDLYRVFINSNSSPQNTSSPPILLSTLEEPTDFPELSSLDLGALLQPIKEEPVDLTHIPSPLVQSPSISNKPDLLALPKVEMKTSKKPRSVKHEPKVSKKEDKYQKRLQANKRSAQASRERKKALKVELEQRVDELNEVNSNLNSTITELEAENKVLKNEFIHLQRLIGESSILSKLMARANMSLLPPEPIDNSSSHMDTSAFAYLMIVLYTFSQHFSNVQNPSSHRVTPPSVTTVA